MIVISYKISYLRKLLTNFIFTSLVNFESTLLYNDNLSVIAIIMNYDNDKTSRIHHIDICYHVIQEVLANSALRLRYVQTADMTADILTKILSREIHDCHMKSMRLDWQ